MNLCSLVSIRGYTVCSTLSPGSCFPCYLTDFLSGYLQFSTAACNAEHIWAAGKNSLNLSPLLFQVGVHVLPVLSGRFSALQHLESGFVAVIVPGEQLHAASLPVFQPLITTSAMQGRSALKRIKMCIWQGKGSGLYVQYVVQTL